MTCRRLSTPDAGATLNAEYLPGTDVVNAWVGVALGLVLVGVPGFLRNLLAAL